MEELGRNEILRGLMPGRGTLYEQLMDGREHLYTLDEFGWTTGVCALQQSDNHRLIGFLRGVTEATGSKEIQVIKREDSDIPVAFFERKIYPNTRLFINLGFMQIGNPLRLIGNSEAESYNTKVNPKKYEGTDYHAGWKRALRQINNGLGHNMNIEMILDKDENVSFKGELPCNYMDNLGDTLNCIVLLLQSVEHSYLVTRELPKQKERVIEDYASQILQATSSSN